MTPSEEQFIEALRLNRAHIAAIIGTEVEVTRREPIDVEELITSLRPWLDRINGIL